jgi:hypothetical protein
MASDKALYLVAAVVLALGVSHHQGLFDRSEDWTQVATDRSLSIADRVSGEAMRLAGMGQVIFSRSELGFVRSEAGMARVQARLACVQTSLARRQAEMARSQVERARAIAIEQVQHEFVVHPQPDFVMETPPPPPAIPTDDTI